MSTQRGSRLDRGRSRSLSRAKPGGLFIAGAIGCEHEVVGIRRAVQVNNSIALCGNGAKVPTGRVNADDLASGLESAGLAWVAFAGWTATETEEAAVRGPVHMVDLFDLILNTHAPF